MGITGLIPFLEKASKQIQLRELAGQCVAIDSYCWLHKGAFACADKLARGEVTDIHIQYCLKYVHLLLSHDIKPILVFDGRHLPAKAGTEAKRRETRNSSKQRAAELLRMGKTEEAKSFLRRCVDITHEMALQLIQECRKRNVDCVVAPYEADAQLAFLNKAGIAQAVITEDSDLMLFGCSKVLFKLDLSGSGLIIEADKLFLAMGCKEEKYTFDKFRYMCILSGCDYLDSLPGIGLAKARKFILMTEETDVRKVLAKIPAYLNMRQLEISEEYTTSFLKADATFKHMIVYDTVKRKQVRLNDPLELGTDAELCSNAGTFLDDEIAFQLALGNLDPFTMRKLDNWHPDDPNCRATGGRTSSWKQTSITKHPSIWKSSYEGRKPSQPDIREDLTRRNAFKIAGVLKRPASIPDTEESQRNQSIDDVLESYGIQKEEPVMKKLCLDVMNKAQKKPIDFSEIEVLNDMAELENSSSKSPKRRNPFQVASTGTITINRRSAGGEILMSPTKLTPENSSLLRNVSPVKRIDFDNKNPSQMRSKNEKLNRFKRTVIASNGQKVISRFFSSGSSSSTVNQQSSSADSIGSSPAREEQSEKERDATSVYLLSPEAKLHHRGDHTPKKQNPNNHGGNLRSPNPPVKGERSVEKVDVGFVEEPEAGLNSSQKENRNVGEKSTRLQLFERETTSDNNDEEGGAWIIEDKSSSSDDVIEVKEESKVKDTQDSFGILSQRSLTAKDSQKKTCKRIGLLKSKKLPDVGATQSKLSMFGFQKKVQLN
ncbi:exonuclease 1 [Toxorhynchites rutilus septentrionalis]|uniref:exonuclease 1 n=1 Tax=Toxorhynchites rutilus septentrionalis TaxID=329112 RepID=UPI0024788747|nr:exonuclease 1 [Toxorhynchites rutilus septentrionalis]